MGQFSWLYANHKRKAMKDNKVANSYLLVPKEFSEIYGDVIYEGCYDGYGHMDKYDIYALVALWNRKYLSDFKLKKPICEEYLGLYDFEKDKLRQAGCSEKEIEAKDYESRKNAYERAMKSYQYLQNTINNFAKSDNDYDAIEDEDMLREIGIMIARDDEDNKRLRYPIKITDAPMNYEDVSYSKSDPNQGW